MKLSNIYNKYLKYIVWFIVLMTISVLVSYYNYEETKRSYDLNKFSELKTKIRQAFKEFERNSDFIFHGIVTNEKIHPLLLQINSHDSTKAALLRKQLYELVKNMNINFEEIGIFKLHFIRLDKTVFLRYFNTNQYNDTFTYQTLLDKVIQTNSPQSAFLSGANDFSYRRIYPIELNGKTICYLEFALSEQYFAEALSYDKSRITLLNYYIKDKDKPLPKNLIKSPFLLDFYISSSINNYYETEYIADLYKEIKDKLDKVDMLVDKLSKTIDFNYHFESINEMYSVYFIPFYNEDKNFNGYLMHAFKNITLENKLIDLIIINTAVGTFLLIILFVSAYRKSIIQKLEQKISELQIEKKRSQSLIQELNNSQIELKEKADFVTKINNLLHEQDEMLRKSLDEKNRFFSILAHDIKNPITSLYTNAELLTIYFDKMDENEKKEIANRLLLSSKNLERLVKDLLEWGKLQLGQYNIDLKEVILKEEIDKIIETYSHDAQIKEITVENHISPTTQITSDPHIVRTIFRNLLQNSIKFTEKGKIVIEILEHSDNHIKIAFRDTGVGIPQEKLQDLFRVDKAFSTRGTRNEEGTGLGLILVNDYIKKIEGSISVKSKIGVGTTFFISFPK